MTYRPLVGNGIYESPGNLPNDAARTLASQINQIVAEERAMREEMGLRYQEKVDDYVAACTSARPSYPTADMRQAIRTALKMLDDGIEYGDHLGYPTQAQLDAGLPNLARNGLAFISKMRHFTLRTDSPWHPRLGRHMWAFEPHEIEAVTTLIAECGYRVHDTWEGDNSVSMRFSRKQVDDETPGGTR